MAKKTQQPAEQTGTKQPDFIAYTVIDRNGDETKGKGIWRSIGSAWMHSDGNGMQIRLDAFPIDGVVTLRAPLPPKSDA
jgi:hypothetical protein